MKSREYYVIVRVLIKPKSYAKLSAAMASHGQINTALEVYKKPVAFWNANRLLAPRNSPDLTGQHSVALRYVPYFFTYNILVPSTELLVPY